MPDVLRILVSALAVCLIKALTLALTLVSGPKALALVLALTSKV